MSSSLLSSCLSVLVSHTCMGCTAEATSLIVDLGTHLLAVKWLSLQVVRVYDATSQVEKE